MDDGQKGLLLVVLAIILVIIFIYVMFVGSGYVECMASPLNLTCDKPWWML